MTKRKFRNWFLPQNPQTGTGYPPPAPDGRERIKVVVKTSDNRRLGNKSQLDRKPNS
jgi:hypothetical protein